MSRQELIQHHGESAGILKPQPDRSQWKEFLAHERTVKQKRFPNEEVCPKNSPLIQPILPVVVWDLPNENRTEELVDRLIIIIWSKEVLSEYNDLPKQTSRERKKVNNLVTQTASRLLENPQDIGIAERIWSATPESEEPFSELVRKECLALIKDKWEDVKSGQLAQLVRISTDDNDPSQNDAKEMLRNYFRGPKSRNQRINAYYNFVSGVLDLAEEDEAFREGMKIALYATDILPKDPSLVEQAILVSIPYKEEESVVLRKTLVVNYIMYQLRFMGLYDMGKFWQDRGDFVKSPEVQGKLRKKEQLVKKAIGDQRLADERIRELNNKMLIFFRDVTQPLTQERKQSLIKTWPYNLAFDETDPLNQKLQKVLASKR